MAITGTTYDFDDYDLLLRKYKLEGFHMRWEMKDGTPIKLEDMKSSHIRNCINMLNQKYSNDTRRAWIEIFTDVQLKRRKLKLDKIKSKLNS